MWYVRVRAIFASEGANVNPLVFDTMSILKSSSVNEKMIILNVACVYIAIPNFV